MEISPAQRAVLTLLQDQQLYPQGLTILELCTALKRRLTAIQVHETLEELLQEGWAESRTFAAGVGLRRTVVRHNATGWGRTALVQHFAQAMLREFGEQEDPTKPQKGNP